MSDVLLQIDSETLNQAVVELSARITDLEGGSQNAPRLFEKIIGSDGTPDLTTEERIARLDAVRAEIQEVLHFIQSEDEEDDDSAPGQFSEHTLVVLTEVAGDREPAELAGPHLMVGQGVPSAHLYQAAAIARGKMSILLLALNDETLAEPEADFLSFFEAYEEVLEEEGLEIEDDMWVCDVAISYLTALCENLDVAWEEGIAIPETLWDHVLGPILDQTLQSKLH